MGCSNLSDAIVVAFSLAQSQYVYDQMLSFVFTSTCFNACTSSFADRTPSLYD
jgi:hypothetical protein